MPSSPSDSTLTQVEQVVADLVAHMCAVPGRSDAPHLDRPPRGRPRVLPSLAL
jgi:hypothetical protein